MKTLKIDPTKIGNIKGTPIERGKALAAKLASPSKPAKLKPSKAKASATTKTSEKKTAKSQTTAKAKREVAAFSIVPVDKQTNYEKRFYMRNFHEKEDATHVAQRSSHGIASASEQCLAFMREVHSKDAAKTHFKTSDLILGITSFGPAYGDSIRNAMRKLAKAGIVKIHIITGKSRAKYDFELLKFAPDPNPKPERTEPAK